MIVVKQNGIKKVQHNLEMIKQLGEWCMNAQNISGTCDDAHPKVVIINIPLFVTNN